VLGGGEKCDSEWEMMFTGLVNLEFVLKAVRNHC
jgi:hypothetical protein